MGNGSELQPRLEQAARDRKRAFDLPRIWREPPETMEFSGRGRPYYPRESGVVDGLLQGSCIECHGTPCSSGCIVQRKYSSVYDVLLNLASLTLRGRSVELGDVSNDFYDHTAHPLSTLKSDPPPLSRLGYGMARRKEARTWPNL